MAEQAAVWEVAAGREVLNVCEAAGLRGIPHYDVRLRREITHRRLAVTLARRVTRVVSLHVLDALLIAGVLMSIGTYWHPPLPAGQYLPAVVSVFLLSLNALGSHRAGGARRDVKRLSMAVVLAILILSCLAAFPPRLPLPQVFLGVLGVCAFLALAAGRKIVDLAVRQVYARGIGLRRALVVGSLDEAGRVIEAIRGEDGGDQFVVGHVLPGGMDDPTALGTLPGLPALLDDNHVQEVLVATTLTSEATQFITTVCFERGISLFMIPAGLGASGCWAEPMRVGACAMLRLHPSRLRFPALLLKRAVDVTLASVALVLLSPLIGLLALAIVLDSPGPVFFRQRRVGLGGRYFLMWKFRSMTVDAEQREAELAHLNIYGNGTFKLRHDPRVTRVGKFLRRTSLDELPQLLNVLWGDMSIVGPRPALVNDIDRYAPHHFERLTVVPGITGPWQVGGRNLVTDFETIIAMERAYIRGWSLLLDLRIMLRTVAVVVRGEGAY